MDRSEDTVSRDQFFHDIMQGFEEAPAFARRQKNLRVTHARIENTGPADTVVSITPAENEDALNSVSPSAPETAELDCLYRAV